MTDVVLVSAVSALGGVVVSSVVTLATRAFDRRREDHARWVTERRDAYVGIVTESRAASTAAWMATIWLENREGELARTEALKSMSAATTAGQRFGDYAKVVDLVSPRDVVAAVDDLADAIAHTSAQALAYEFNHKTFTVEATRAATQEIDRHRTKVIQLARTDLGIRSRTGWPRLGRQG